MKTLVAVLFYIVTYAASGVGQGCKKDKNSSAIINPPPADTVAITAKKYLALGDSYTIGQGVGATERFPYLIVQALQQAGIKMAEPTYVATTGWTTGNLLMAINNVTGTYDVVTVLIGVNDQYQGVDTATYKNRFTQILQKAVQFAGNKITNVVVLSIPDYSATPFVTASEKATVSAEIDMFNAINKRVTEESGIKYVNITNLSREAATDLSLLAPDRLHYSAKEHRIWADLVAPLFKTVLQ